MYTCVAIDNREFGFDPSKRERNLRKHKLDLLRGAEMFDGRPAISYPSPRNGENRVVTVARVGELIVALVWVEREGVIGLISLRRARDAEKRVYHARVCH